MAEEKKEKWLNALAFTTVFIAVCATLATFKGSGYSTKSLMNQSRASDQWSFFQSKSIKSYIFEMQKNNLDLQKSLSNSSSKNKEFSEKYDSEIAKFTKKIEQYEKEKEEIKKAADDFELQRDNCKKHSSAFGIAVIFLQISILLSSISALIKKKYIWYIGIGVGAAGVLFFFNGFFLFF